MNERLQHAPENLTRKLADFTVSFTLESAPKTVLENAKTVILDCLGVSLLAGSQEIGTALLNFGRANASPGPCTLWGTLLTAGPRDAALINGTLAHGLDYDDRNHSSTYSLATSVAVAEPSGLSGAKTLEAFIVGREVRNSLDPLFGKRGSGIGPGARGWHSNGILGSIASACAASRALDLSAQQTLTAIGLAAGSCGALTRDGGTMAKPFRTGHAAGTGLTCALLAKSGFSSDDSVLEGRYGLLEALGPIPEDILQTLGTDLGSKFNLESAPRIKPHSSCSATHNGLEAMLRLVQKHRVDPEATESIACDLKPYPLVRHMPQRGFEGRFSMAFCLAMALIQHRLAPNDFLDAHVHNERVQDLMRRTRHTPDAPALVVILKDGTRIEEKLQHPTNLQGREAVEDKFKNCVEGLLDDNASQTVIDCVRRLEALASIQMLTKALQAKPIEPATKQ
jgi:2-methylcitrate dehydratase PrpD